MFFFLLQSEFGDLYKVTLDYEKDEVFGINVIVRNCASKRQAPAVASSLRACSISIQSQLHRLCV